MHPHLHWPHVRGVVGQGPGPNRTPPLHGGHGLMLRCIMLPMMLLSAVAPTSVRLHGTAGPQRTTSRFRCSSATGLSNIRLEVAYRGHINVPKGFNGRRSQCSAPASLYISTALPPLPEATLPSPSLPA